MLLLEYRLTFRSEYFRGMLRIMRRLLGKFWSTAAKLGICLPRLLNIRFPRRRALQGYRGTKGWVPVFIYKRLSLTWKNYLAKLVLTLGKKIEYQKQHNGPIWNGTKALTLSTARLCLTFSFAGEWGPVYADADDTPDWQEVNKDRYHLVKDQLQLYEDAGISWSIWLYKVRQ